MFKDLNNQFLTSGVSISGKLNSQYAPIASSDKLTTIVVGILTLIFIWLGIVIPMFLGFKGGSTEGMIVTA